MYSDDQITARYVLSYSLMQRILKFNRQHNAIYLSFVDGRLYIGIPIIATGIKFRMGKTVILPLFEPNISSTLLDFKIYRKYFIYMLFVKDIVEELNLNQRIWSKGSPSFKPAVVLSQENLRRMIGSG